MQKQRSFELMGRILAVSLALLTVLMIGLVIIDNCSITMPAFLSELPLMESSNGIYLVSVNTAPVEALQEINGIGPVLSSAIVDYREVNGAFEALEDLLNVKGIGEATLKKIRPYLTVD